MVVLKELYRLSKKAEEYINITEEVHQLIRESGVKNGIAAVITSHTTTGIFVNEALPCVESEPKFCAMPLYPLRRSCRL